MKEIIKKIYEDKIAATSFTASLSFFAITLIAVLIFYRFLPPYLPLYNKLAWGYARLGNTIQIFVPLLVVFLLILINTYFGVKLQNKIPLLARFLYITTFSIAVFTTIFILKLLLVII